MPNRPNRHDVTRVALLVVVGALLVAAVLALVLARSADGAPAAETIAPVRVDRVPAPADPTVGLGAAVYLHAVDDERRAEADRIAAERREAARRAESRRASRSSSRRSGGGSGGHRGYATWYECTAAVENHGDYGRSTNPTHFGRYQFSRGTWAAYGGNPDTWGHASPAEQDAVFARAVAAGGESNWRPYNGC